MGRTCFIIPSKVGLITSVHLEEWDYFTSVHLAVNEVSRVGKAESHLFVLDTLQCAFAGHLIHNKLSPVDQAAWSHNVGL